MYDVTGDVSDANEHAMFTLHALSFCCGKGIARHGIGQRSRCEIRFQSIYSKTTDRYVTNSTPVASVILPSKAGTQKETQRVVRPSAHTTAIEAPGQPPDAQRHVQTQQRRRARA